MDQAVLAFADDQMIERENEKGAKERILRFKYDRHDMLPDMPDLQETSTAGCPFCPFLRRSIEGYIRHERVQAINQPLDFLHVEYAWIQTDQGCDDLPCGWKLELRFIFELEKTCRVDEVVFEICAPKGEFSP